MEIAGTEATAQDQLAELPPAPRISRCLVLACMGALEPQPIVKSKPRHRPYPAAWDIGSLPRRIGAATITGLEIPEAGRGRQPQISGLRSRSEESRVVKE